MAVVLSTSCDERPPNILLFFFHHACEFYLNADCVERRGDDKEIAGSRVAHVQLPEVLRQVCGVNHSLSLFLSLCTIVGDALKFDILFCRMLFFLRHSKKFKKAGVFARKNKRAQSVNVACNQHTTVATTATIKTAAATTITAAAATHYT